jgi:hypothetical protein
VGHRLEADRLQCRIEGRVDLVGQALSCRAAGGDGGEALLRVTAVGFEVQGRQRLDGGSLGGIEVPQRDQMVGQGPGLVARPGVERGDELNWLDQPVLQR